MVEKSENGKLCVPGMRLSVSDGEHTAGPGTCEIKGYVYATLAGKLQYEENEKAKVGSNRTLKLNYHNYKNQNIHNFRGGFVSTVISVISPKTPSVVPKCGDVVTAKVTVVNSRMVNCTIICVGPSVLARTYKGVLKKEDIKATDKDRVDPYKCFRPGDIILAKVLPMTEVHWCHLTTAENELGVAIATAEGSPEGVSMVPISWSEMQCPKTLVKEQRKVARVLPEYINQSFVPFKEEDQDKIMEKEKSKNIEQEAISVD